jgi:cytochrome c oxidase subunit 2
LFAKTFDFAPSERGNHNDISTGTVLCRICVADSAGNLAPTTSAQTTPPQPIEVHITARRFEFDPRIVTVRKGQPAKLTITSEDVDHGFAIQEFGINIKVPAKQTKVVEFTPDRAGHFQIRCTVYCGEDHENMAAELVVEDTQLPEDLKVTFDEQSPTVAIVESRGQRFRIDTATKTFTRIAEAETTAAVASSRTKN